MTTYKGGVTFDGDPDEIVLVSPQTIRAAMPDEAQDWKDYIDRVYGYSQPANYMRKKDLFDFVLNAWAQLFLPQYTFVGFTIYNAAHYFLLADDLRPDNNLAPDAVLGMWTVTATGHFYDRTTTEAEPCFDRYRQSSSTYTYFGYSPSSHKAQPYPAPCKQEVVHYEIEQRSPGRVLGFNNDAWTGRDDRGNTTSWCSGGGISAELTTMEVTEGGLLFVSLPPLPDNVPYPPPLVGRVVDYGPPGPEGPPGPPGPPGADGGPLSDIDLVNQICNLPEDLHDGLKNCLDIPEPVTLFQLASEATPVEIANTQQVLIETAPETMIQTGEVVLAEEGEATMIATAVGAGRIHWILTLPIAALIGLKMILQTVKVSTCKDKVTPWVDEIPFPVLSIGDNTQREVFQAIFDQFAMLLRCCKPCELDAWEFIDTVEGKYENFRLRDYDAIRLVFKAPPGPEINTWYRSGTIHKFGELRWVYEDHIDFHIFGWKPRQSTLLFWNSEDQLFEMPNHTIVGVTVDMEYIKRYEVWGRLKQRLPSETPTL